MLKTPRFRYCALLFFAVPLHRNGYTFDDSEAVIDGKFIGLPLDDINEDDKTETRIEAWLAQITPDM